MISFEITEPSFDKKKTTEYELSVLLGADSLSYCILDETSRVLSVVKCDFPEKIEGKGYADRLEKIILRNIPLQQPYRAIYVGIFNLKSTLVPTRLYDVEEKSTYLEKMLPLSGAYEIRVDSLNSIGAEHVYVVENSISKVLKNYFSGAEIIHSVTALYKGVRQSVKGKSDKCIFLNVRPEALQITLMDNGEFVFYNAFTYTSSKDFIYYVMLVYDQFSLQPDTTPIYLSGELMEDSEMYHLIYRYIRHLKLVEVPEWIELSSQWDNRPQHWFYDLFCMSLMKI